MKLPEHDKLVIIRDKQGNERLAYLCKCCNVFRCVATGLQINMDVISWEYSDV